MVSAWQLPALEGWGRLSENGPVHPRHQALCWNSTAPAGEEDLSDSENKGLFGAPSW